MRKGTEKLWAAGGELLKKVGLLLVLVIAKAIVSQLPGVVARYTNTTERIMLSLIAVVGTALIVMSREPLLFLLDAYATNVVRSEGLPKTHERGLRSSLRTCASLLILLLGSQFLLQSIEDFMPVKVVASINLICLYVAIILLMLIVYRLIPVLNPFHYESRKDSSGARPGVALSILCQRCGYSSEPQAQFCRECGAPLPKETKEDAHNMGPDDR